MSEEIKAFKRKKARGKKDGVKFSIDDVEFETVVASIPQGLALEMVDVDKSEGARVTLKFFRTILGPDQFKLFVATLDDPQYAEDGDLLGDVAKHVMGKFAGRF